MDGTPRQNKTKLIYVTFGEGSLGVTLRRRPEDGVVFVYDIVENSQAVDMDISVGDELWSIGESEIGDVALDKEAWNGLVQYIKFSPRPLKATWRRKGGSSKNDNAVEVRQPEASENLQAENGVNISDDEEPEVLTKTNPFKPPVKPPKPVRAGSSSVLIEPVKTASSSAPSDADSDLQELSNRLVLKEKANGFSAITSKRGGDTSAVHLMKEGRRILRSGELETTTKAALAMWATQNKRQFILLTDMLIIATPVGAQLLVENMIDLPVCKLYCEGQSTGETNTAQSNGDGARQENTFQLIWPGGTLLVTAKNTEEKERWVESIFTAICECVEADSSHVLGWRHQYMQGSMHSAVISRDESKVKDLISKCECGLLSFTVIDSLDEDGYSPLHYACILRLPGIIRALCDTGSDSTIEDSRGLTPFHWAALQLDEQALSILCQHVVDIDLRDHKGRTPLYLACVEGRDVSGKTDSRMLAQCLKTLLTNSADTDFKDEKGYTVMHYLSASWQYEPLNVILDHTEKANIFSFSVEDGMNALHYACDASPLKRAVGEGSWILSNTQASRGEDEDDSSPAFKDLQQEELLIEDGLPTLKALLQAGDICTCPDCQTL
jgi:Ankyrin repeats (3 copies)/Ankyrin repeat